ncbi:MAG: hypothetical protein ABSE56_03580 [Bryobacteraceae bacterium]|jgi:hypothetical protein
MPRILPFLISLLAGCGSLVPIAGQPPAPVQPATSPPPVLEGTWEVKPLVMKGTAVPGGAGQLLELGEAYVTENWLAFWARTGPRLQDDWTLFSWNGGKLARILQHGVGFVAPDSRKVTVFRSPEERFETVHAGRRLLYFSPSLPDHIYAWDGEKLVKVLVNGDELQFGEGRYLVKRARVLGVGAGGKALVFWESPKQHTHGWALHDGVSFTPLWKKGDELPGLPGVRTDELSVCEDCTWASRPPRLLEDGSLVAVLRVAQGGRKRLALFRISPGKAEEIVAEGKFLGQSIELVEILAATPHAILVDASHRSTSIELGSITLSMRTQLLSFAAGKLQVQPAWPEREIRAIGGVPEWQIQSAVFLAPDSPRALVTMKVARWKLGIPKKLLSYPTIHFWDGQTAASVAWEDALGLSPEAVVKLVQRREGFWGLGADAVALANLRAIPGPVGGVSVALPPLGDAPRRWYVPADSRDGSLRPPPRFPVAGHNITLADVLSWKESNEVLAGTEEGFFLLRRTR